MALKKRQPYRILIIAGGGVFGAIPAAFLAKHFKDKPLTDHFDCFAGTSIGGILSMMYANGCTAESVLHDFKVMAPKAFPKRKWYQRINPFRPSYKGKGLQEALQEAFGETTAGELVKPIVVPSMDFELLKPKVFDTLIKDVDADRPCWEIGMATAAAPTYFPPFQSFIDGGLVANIPIMETVAAVRNAERVAYRDMEVFVLGTGHYPTIPHDMREVRKWSKFKWIMPIIDLAVKANEMRSAFISRQMDFKKLEIFDPVVLEPSWKMDDPKLVPIVESMSEKFTKAFDESFAKFK
jgi:patatin-like phospholipase/acyl hydrolase